MNKDEKLQITLNTRRDISYHSTKMQTTGLTDNNETKREAFEERFTSFTTMGIGMSQEAFMQRCAGSVGSSQSFSKNDTLLNDTASLGIEAKEGLENIDFGDHETSYEL